MNSLTSTHPARYGSSHLLLIATFAVALSGCGFVGPDNPSDDYARELFEDHRDSIAVLADMMASEEGVHLVHSDGNVSYSGNGEELSDKRLQDYLDLMSDAGVECVSQDYGDIEIVIFAEGNVAESFTLALVRAEEVPADELADTTYDTAPDNTTRYAHIEGDWYIRRVHD